MAEPPPEAPPPPVRPARSSFLDQFRGLPWWQIALAILPMTLIAIGGLIGGLVGAVGTLANLSVARSSTSPAIKAVAMIGITVGCYVVVIVVATILYAALHPNG